MFMAIPKKGLSPWSWSLNVVRTKNRIDKKVDTDIIKMIVIDCVHNLIKYYVIMVLQSLDIAIDK